MSSRSRPYARVQLSASASSHARLCKAYLDDTSPRDGSEVLPLHVWQVLDQSELVLGSWSQGISGLSSVPRRRFWKGVGGLRRIFTGILAAQLLIPFIVAALLVPEDVPHPTGRAVDWLGAALLLFAQLSAPLALSFGANEGWATSRE